MRSNNVPVPAFGSNNSNYTTYSSVPFSLKNSSNSENKKNKKEKNSSNKEDLTSDLASDLASDGTLVDKATGNLLRTFKEKLPGPDTIRSSGTEDFSKSSMRLKHLQGTNQRKYRMKKENHSTKPTLKDNTNLWNQFLHQCETMDRVRKDAIKGIFNTKGPMESNYSFQTPHNMWGTENHKHRYPPYVPPTQKGNDNVVRVKQREPSIEIQKRIKPTIKPRSLDDEILGLNGPKMTFETNTTNVQSVKSRNRRSHDFEMDQKRDSFPTFETASLIVQSVDEYPFTLKTNNDTKQLMITSPQVNDMGSYMGRTVTHQKKKKLSDRFPLTRNATNDPTTVLAKLYGYNDIKKETTKKHTKNFMPDVIMEANDNLNPKSKFIQTNKKEKYGNGKFTQFNISTEAHGNPMFGNIQTNKRNDNEKQPRHNQSNVSLNINNFDQHECMSHNSKPAKPAHENKHNIVDFTHPQQMSNNRRVSYYDRNKVTSRYENENQNNSSVVSTMHNSLQANGHLPKIQKITKMIKEHKTNMEGNTNAHSFNHVANVNALKTNRDNKFTDMPLGQNMDTNPLMSIVNLKKKIKNDVHMSVGKNFNTGNAIITYFQPNNFSSNLMSIQRNNISDVPDVMLVSQNQVKEFKDYEILDEAPISNTEIRDTKLKLPNKKNEAKRQDDKIGSHVSMSNVNTGLEVSPDESRKENKSAEKPKNRHSIINKMTSNKDSLEHNDSGNNIRSSLSTSMSNAKNNRGARTNRLPTQSKTSDGLKTGISSEDRVQNVQREKKTLRDNESTRSICSNMSQHLFLESPKFLKKIGTMTQKKK
jgi:hypothetical protein